MDFELSGTKTLYLFNCDDYEGTSGLGDLKIIVKNSKELKQYIQTLIDTEISERESLLAHFGDIENRCSSLYLISEKLKWSDAVIFEAIGNKIESRSICAYKENEISYQTEVEDDDLLDTLYNFALERIDTDKLK